MPQNEQFIILENKNAATVLATAFETFKTLGWSVLFAGDNKLLGTTPKNWKTKGQQILITALDNELKVQSEMVNGEALDIAGVNKKNVTSFFAAYRSIENNITYHTVDTNNAAIHALQTQTEIAVVQEQKEAAEIDAAMNLSDSNLYATYTIIGINVLVFIFMALNGAGIMQPNALVHIKWGSNFTALTLSGDWWRLLSNIFIHFGLIHIVMNMYALYSIGMYLEPLLGKIKYITAYLCTGVLASLVSLWWHKEGVNSAGASGAIFGMYGLFLALLTTDIIPKKLRTSLLPNIGIFVLYNLAYGMKGGIDNAAHTGGLVSGFAIGYIFVLVLKAVKKEQQIKWALPLIIIATAGIAYVYLDTHKASITEREKIMNELGESNFKDAEKFNKKFDEFVEKQKEALAIMDDTIATPAALKINLQKTSAPLWKQNETIAKELQQMQVSPAQHKKADAVLAYILLRKEELGIALRVLDNEPGASEKLQQVRLQIQETMNEIK